MRIIKIGALILLVVFAGMQFIPAEHNQSDVVPLSDFTNIYEVPEEVEDLIQMSCYDCHSNNTDYPWYDKIQPVRWFLEDHIREGKAELNFNEFGNYSERRKINKLKSVRSEIEKGKMPLASYIWMHRDAKLSAGDKKLIITWLDEFMNKQKGK